jgi:rhamnulokinase
MSEQVYLGVDLGAESGRVMAGNFNGQTISIQEIHRFPNGPVNFAGTLRWDVLRLWSEISYGLKKAADKYGAAIRSVGVDTWGVDYVLLSKHDDLVCQPYNYRDPRTQGMMNFANQRVSKEDIYRETGLQFMEINTLYQLLAANQRQPETLKQASHFLMIPDFFHWLLCGAKVVEFTNATTSQCLSATTRDWATPMLQKLELPTHISPQVVTPGTQLGTLKAEVMLATGLKKIPVIAPPTHDTASAVVGVPTQNTGKANWAYISSGTWSLIGVEVPQAILTKEALAQNITNEGGVDGTYRLLKNVMGLWLVQGIRKSFEKQGQKYHYSELTTFAHQSEPFRTIINPNDPRFLAPDDMLQAIVSYCEEHGQLVPQTPGQFVRCALESLALKYRLVLTGIEQLTGEKLEVIHIVGGGTNNDLLNQFTANACGKKVITGPVEATVLGNLLIQARSLGDIGSLGQIRDVVRNSFMLQSYEPQKLDEWNAAYERYLKL